MIKKGMYYLPRLFALILFCAFVSCSNPCKDVKCNFGTCVEGICDCDAGYEGVLCDREIRAKFVGIWEGPLTECLPDLPDTLAAGLALLNGTSIVFLPAQGNAENLIFSIPNPISPVNALTTVDGNNFSISPTIINIDFMGFPIGVVLSGTGQWLNDQEMELTLTLEVPIVGGSECTLTLMRQ